MNWNKRDVSVGIGNNNPPNKQLFAIFHSGSCFIFVIDKCVTLEMNIHIMKKVNVLLCALLQPLWLCAQTVLPLASPSDKLKADIQVNEKSVQIALFDKGGKVVEAKTLQLELDKNILAENWQIR